MLYVPVNSFSHVEMFSCLPGLNQYKAEDKDTAQVSNFVFQLMSTTEFEVYDIDSLVLVTLQ